MPYNYGMIVESVEEEETPESMRKHTTLGKQVPKYGRFTAQHRHVLAVVLGIAVAVVVLLAAAVVFIARNDTTAPERKNNGNPSPEIANQTEPEGLAGRTFYRDDTRYVTKLTVTYRENGDEHTAMLLKRIATQPGTTWLIGPNDSDPTAERDIREVVRTSAEAAEQGTVNIYQLYAIPRRDACARFSGGGFSTAYEYLTWLDRVIAELETDAIFALEADAVGHAAQENCLSPQETNER